MRKILLFYLPGLFISAGLLMGHGYPLTAQSPNNSHSNRGMDVIIHTPKPYNNLIGTIRAMGGAVTIQYDNADAIAARLPISSIHRLRVHPSVKGVEKDRIVELPPAPKEDMDARSLSVKSSQIFDSPALSAKIGELPERFPSYITDVTGASKIWPETGAGGSTITAVIDTGTEASHTCLSGHRDMGHSGSRVIAGPDLSPDAGTEFEGSTLSTNNFHGTFVGGVIASNCFMVLDKRVPSDVDLALIFEAHLPPGAFFTSGELILVPLVGLAPESSIYAVKVFPHTGSGVATSIIEAALDHVITKKKQFRAGEPGGLDIDVVNMSLGGAALFDGRTLEEQLVDAATEAGMVVVVAAGNEGPAPVSVGKPGTAFTALTAGAASDPVHTRIVWDLIFGQGQGLAMYPQDEIRPASFSGRGPLADGRASPDVLATGVFNLSLLNGGATGFASGTSFASPGVAGGAALLSAWTKANRPALGPLAIRNAIIDGAAPLSGDWKRHSQGSGYLNLFGALELLKSGEAANELRQLAPDEALPNVVFQNGGFTTTINSLSPGRAKDFVFEIDAKTSVVTINLTGVTIDPNPVPAALPNSIEIYLKSAKRGGMPYLVYSANVVGPAALTIGDEFVYLAGSILGAFLDEGPMEPGLMKLTVEGDWTNNGDVGATITIRRFDGKDRVVAGERILPGDTILVPVDIPPGTIRADFELGWRHNWAEFPTNDLDMVLCAPGFVLFRDFSGATLNSPERIGLSNPVPGTWHVMVLGFGMSTPEEAYYLNVDVAAPRERVPGGPTTEWVGPKRLDNRHNPLGHNEAIFKGEPCF